MSMASSRLFIYFDIDSLSSLSGFGVDFDSNISDCTRQFFVFVLKTYPKSNKGVQKPNHNRKASSTEINQKPTKWIGYG
ncbi:hypothetical protein HanPSC8_Chr03g0126491 [Helianthus annuus]|nr:hypothetical protein HanPSC8_Chr03g0126491 [Helianthus annuus]